MRGSYCGLVCVSLMADDAERHFRCLLLTRIFPWVKRVFVPFTPVLIESFRTLSSVCVGHVVGKCFLCGSPSHLPKASFGDTKCLMWRSPVYQNSPMTGLVASPPKQSAPIPSVFSALFAKGFSFHFACKSVIHSELAFFRCEAHGNRVLICRMPPPLPQVPPPHRALCSRGKVGRAQL